jgi:nucleotide-binding universal stress UspA family protein
MFKRIVVGAVSSESAERAVAVAVEQARANGAELHLVTVVDAHDIGGESSVDHAQGHLDSITQGLSGMVVHSHVIPGTPAEGILRVAGELSADLVVVGNKGMRGAGRVLGSVPNTVTHKAASSVLIVNTTD